LDGGEDFQRVSERARERVFVLRREVLQCDGESLVERLRHLSVKICAYFRRFERSFLD